MKTMRHEILKKFAASLAFLMNRHGDDQASLAKKIECSTSLISHYLHAKRFPRWDKLERIAQIYKIKDPQTLLNQENLTIPH